MTRDKLHCYLWGWQEVTYLSMATATVVNSDPCCAISVQGYRYGSTRGNTLPAIVRLDLAQGWAACLA